MIGGDILTGLVTCPGNNEYDPLRMCVRFADPGNDEVMDSGMAGMVWFRSSAFELMGSY
jgi:hypothetical protein